MTYGVEVERLDEFFKATEAEIRKIATANDCPELNKIADGLSDLAGDHLPDIQKRLDAEPRDPDEPLPHELKAMYEGG